MREEYLEERSRLIKVVARLELMKGPHQRSRTGSRETPLTSDEDQFREGLEEMQGRLVQPGQFNSRLESLDKLQYLERKPQEVSWHAFSDEDQRRIVQVGSSRLPPPLCCHCTRFAVLPHATATTCA